MQILAGTVLLAEAVVQASSIVTVMPPSPANRPLSIKKCLTLI
jgi:hypothetical protein